MALNEIVDVLYVFFILYYTAINDNWEFGSYYANTIANCINLTIMGHCDF